MLVKMTRFMFESMNDHELGEACFAPFIPMIRGKDMKVKTRDYQQLTNGQQALFMFYAYYNHAVKSKIEFYWWSAYYLSQPKAYEKVFKAESMLPILEKNRRGSQDKKYSTKLRSVHCFL